jgi:hypothetical protein
LEGPGLFEHNIAKKGSGGVVFVADDGLLKVSHLLFRENKAIDGNGGAFAVGGKSCVPVVIEVEDDLVKVGTIPPSEVDITLSYEVTKEVKSYCMAPMDYTLFVENSLPYGMESNLKVSVGYGSQAKVIIDKFIQGPRDISFDLPLSNFNVGIMLDNNVSFFNNFAQNGGALSSMQNDGIIKTTLDIADALKLDLVKADSPYSCIRPVENVKEFDYVRDSAVKTDLTQQLTEYSMVTHGKCAIYVTTIEECNQAAQSLKLTRTNLGPGLGDSEVESYRFDKDAINFFSSDNNTSDKETIKGCYFENNTLKFNANMRNNENCSATKSCICVGKTNNPTSCFENLGSQLSRSQCLQKGKSVKSESVLYVETYTKKNLVMYGRYFANPSSDIDLVIDYINDGSNELRMNGGYEECAAKARSRGYMYFTMKESNIYCGGYIHHQIKNFNKDAWKSFNASKVLKTNQQYVFWTYKTYMTDVRLRNATLPQTGLCFGINTRNNEKSICNADNEVGPYMLQLGETFSLVDVPPMNKFDCAARIGKRSLSNSKSIFGFNNAETNFLGVMNFLIYQNR